MEANELRIGNYVASDHFKDRDVIVKVRLIGQDQAIVEHPNGLSEPMLYKGEMRGIKLTEDILLKIKNCKIDNLNYNIIQGPLTIIIRLCSGNVYCEFGGVYIGDRVTYLHQLQNLFFSLYGKELEVKL